VPPDALYDLILEGLAEDHTAKEARTALGLPGGYEAENHSILTVLLRQYQSQWKQHDGLLYYRMQLYVPAAGGARTEVLCCHHDDPVAGDFGAKRTLELVARKYYWPGMLREVKAYTRACLTC
jgi:D-mannonate dehydratase